MLDQIVYWTGVVVVGSACVAIAALAAIGCALLSNRAQNHLMESYGGWKIFREYRDWYHENKREKDAK